MRILEDMWLLLNHGFWYGAVQPWISSITYLSSWMCHQQLWRTPNYVPPLHCELCLAQWAAQDDHDHTIIPLHIFLIFVPYMVCLVLQVQFLGLYMCQIYVYLCMKLLYMQLCNVMAGNWGFDDVSWASSPCYNGPWQYSCHLAGELYILNLWTFAFLRQVY